jgi:hypothetical protein
MCAHFLGHSVYCTAQEIKGKTMEADTNYIYTAVIKLFISENMIAAYIKQQNTALPSVFTFQTLSRYSLRLTN